MHPHWRVRQPCGCTQERARGSTPVGEVIKVGDHTESGGRVVVGDGDTPDQLTHRSTSVGFTGELH
jgi:hypothetical protein